MPVVNNHRTVGLDEPIPETTDGIGAESNATVAEPDGVDDPSAEVDGAEGTTTEKFDSRLVGMNAASVATYGVLPALALILALVAGGLKWANATVRESHSASTESLAAARNSTVELLSYGPDTVEKDLMAARGLLTSTFRDEYTKLITEVVIPGAQEQRISAVANVPAAASVSATPTHAVVIAFVNQATTVGDGPPTNTTSTVRVTMDRVDGHWLIASFDPI